MPFSFYSACFGGVRTLSNKYEVGSFTKTNISFSGCDMVATINIPNSKGVIVTKALGSLQTLSYSTHMDKKPIRVIGNVNPVAFVNGPRTIAGSLVFAVFNEHFLKEIYADERLRSDYDSEFNQYILTDEMPPFDITISMANEYGARSRMAIYGVTFANEGKAISVNDVYTENTYQFLALDLEYLESEALPDLSHAADPVDGIEVTEGDARPVVLDPTEVLHADQTSREEVE